MRLQDAAENVTDQVRSQQNEPSEGRKLGERDAPYLTINKLRDSRHINQVCFCSTAEIQLFFKAAFFFMAFCF